MEAVRIDLRHIIREIAIKPVILWIELGGKPKWLLLNFGFNDVMQTSLGASDASPNKEEASGNNSKGNTFTFDPTPTPGSLRTID